MAMIRSLTEAVGKTPLLLLTNYQKSVGAAAEIAAKLEYLNPAGSVKDRAAYYMIKDAEAAGRIRPGDTLIEPTSGNTGIGLASIGVPRGYRVILTMPESMSVERRMLLAAYGAEIVLTPASEGMQGAVDHANSLAKEIPGTWIPGQFANESNARAHYETTAPEIFSDTNGNIDFFVAGVGTGGTITGCGRFLKEHCPGVKIIAVEPFDSPLLSERRAGPHKLQGIGANFVPCLLDKKAYDKVMTVKTEEAFETARLLAKTEGVLAGISSGAALAAATSLAKQEENRGKRIVVLLPDTGDRYLSTPLFSGEDAK